MAKKKSIREFVSEDDLKFQLYLLKYSQQLRNLEEKTPEEIQKQFNDEIDKRLNLINKDREKIPKSNKIAHEALDMNEIYVKSWVAPLDKEKIKEKFYQKKDNYLNYLTNRIQEENRDQDKEMLIYAKDVILSSKESKERFGQMLLLMIKNMATMPSFSGYTENWKTDFFSNAIEKTLLYVHNFDEDLLSKRTGGTSKAFAYVTQICFNAFVNIINIRKAESEFIKDTITYNTSNVDGMKQNVVNSSITLQDDAVNDKILFISETTDIAAYVDFKIREVQESNEAHRSNKAIREEIKFIEKTSTEEEKLSKDYEDYIRDMVQTLKGEAYPEIINHLIFQKPKGMNLPDGFKLPSMDFTISVRGPLEPKPKKVLPKKEKALEEIELEEFNEEWE